MKKKIQQRRFHCQELRNRQISKIQDIPRIEKKKHRRVQLEINNTLAQIYSAGKRTAPV